MAKQAEVQKLQTIEELKVEYQKPKEEKILDVLKTIYDYRPIGAEQEVRQNSVARLVEEWFRLKMAGNYSELVDGIFELQRGVTIDTSKHKVNDNYRSNSNDVSVDVQIPLFCSVSLGQPEWTHKVSGETGGWAGDKKYYSIELSSKAPFILADAIRAATEAKRYCYEVYMAAMKTKPLDEILTLAGDIFPEPGQAELKLLWYARPADLKVKVTEVNKDPAIVLVWHRPYLVYQWNENTLPIEDLMLDALKA